MSAPHSCSVCGGQLALLGVLGKLAWLRCIACGMQSSCDAADIIIEDEDKDEDYSEPDPEREGQDRYIADVDKWES